jgi:hypothetical protein
MKGENLPSGTKLPFDKKTLWKRQIRLSIRIKLNWIKCWTANDFGPKIKVHRSMTDAEEGRFVAGTIFEQKMQNHEQW